MKFTNVVACSAALLSTSVLARSTVYVTVVTCVSTDSAIPTATDVVSPTDAAPTDVSPTDVSPTEVSPTEVSPTDTAPTDVPVPSDTPDGTYPITGKTVNCRAGPGTSYPVKKTYSKGDTVTITCQTSGTKVNGNAIWDLTSDGCYLTDYYVKTGTSKYIKPQCDAASIPAPPAPTEPTEPTNPGTGGGDTGNAGEIKNDYPYGASTCGDVDRWLYYACQCTSFVAWRINERLGINFHNKFKGAAWGNANSWDEAARAVGVKVDNKPVPGSVAQTNAGGAGHVAWVASVDGDFVTIEEFNYVNVEGYGTRTLPASTFKYIHLKY
ncbi:hypothetical protein V498_04055 [Pseudogymnoascus sp. VKM F-4517 (FW-2822)]|nr:hypothetical protein V498_04055 [Pseudogymnoascus sp. VKM F-4517 (FW-2822)]